MSSCASRHQRSIDDRDARQSPDEGRKVEAGDGHHRQSKAEEAIASELQQDAREDHRASCWRFDMGIGQPSMERPHRQFDGKGSKKGEPQPILHIGGEIMAEQFDDIGGPSLFVDGEDGEQHQQRSGERVEKKLKAGIDAPRPAPYPDDEKHRDESALKEEVKQDKIKRRKNAEQQSFRAKERLPYIL